MKKIGTVSKIENGNTYVKVECETACGHDCSECASSCHDTVRVCLAKNTLGAKVGDRVEMHVSDNKVVLLSFLVYMLPLILIFGIWTVTERIFRSNTVSIVSVMVVVVLWLIFIRRYNRRGVVTVITNVL